MSRAVVTSRPQTASRQQNNLRQSLPSRQADSNAADLLLNEAVLWLSPNNSTPGETVAVNKGWGGAALNAQYASTSSSANYPTMLPWSGENYMYLPGDAGNYASVPDAANLRISGDIDISVRCSSDDWTPAAVGCFVHKRIPNAQGYSFQINLTTGRPFLVVVLSGVQVVLASVAAPTIADGQNLWIRATRDATTGTTIFYTAPDSASAPSVWTQLGSSVAGTAGTIDTGTQQLRIGADSGGTTTCFGKFFRVIVKSGIGGTTVLDTDFTANTNQTSFVCSTGQTVTITRAATGKKAAVVVRPVWLFGNSGYLSVPDNALLNFDINQSFTVLATQRHHNVTVAAYQAIVTKGIFAGSNPGWFMTNNNSTSAVRMQVLDLAGNAPVIQFGARVNGQSHVISMRRDAVAHTFKGNVDATVSTNTADTTTVTNANARTLRVGIFDANSFPLEGEITQVVLWQRLITDTEIATLNASLV